MIYNYEWYGQNMLLIVAAMEAIKNFGGHYLRNLHPKLLQFYPAVVKIVAMVLAMGIAFGAKADLLVSIGVVGMHPYVGYFAAGIVLFGGDTALDTVWDNRGLIALIFEMFKPTLTASSATSTEAMPLSMAADNRAVWERYIDERINFVLAHRENF